MSRAIENSFFISFSLIKNVEFKGHSYAMYAHFLSEIITANDLYLLLELVVIL
jgi:hypothetical protein